MVSVEASTCMVGVVARGSVKGKRKPPGGIACDSMGLADAVSCSRGRIGRAIPLSSGAAPLCVVADVNGWSLFILAGHRACDDLEG